MAENMDSQITWLKDSEKFIFDRLHEINNELARVCLLANMLVLEIKEERVEVTVSKICDSVQSAANAGHEIAKLMKSWKESEV